MVKQLEAIGENVERFKPLYLAFVAVATFVGLSACSQPEGRPQVAGTVTLRGSAVGSKTLYLKYDAPDSFTQMLQVKADGTFVGEVPKTGQYKVIVLDSMAVLEGGAPAPNANPTLSIPAKYKDPATSDVSVTVNNGKNTLIIELKD